MSDGNHTILCVAVEDSTLKRIRETAANLGVAILDADTVGEAYLLYKDSLQGIDLLILDFDTLGQRGAELENLIESGKPGVKALYLCSAQHIEHLRGNGRRILVKPVDAMEFEDLVESIL